MKAFLQKSFYSWRFYNLGQERYTECVRRTFGDNLNSVAQINTIAATMMACFTLYPAVLEKNYSKAGIYIIAALVALLIGAVAAVGLRRRQKQKDVSRPFIFTLIVLSYANIMLFGILLSVFNNRQQAAGMFLCLLICALFMFINPPAFNLVLTLGALAVFIISVITMKPPELWSLDIVNAIAAGALSVISTWLIVRFRMVAMSSRRRIENIIQKLPGMVYQHLYEFPECTILYASEGSKEYIGYTPEELVGGRNKFMEMVHPDDLEEMRNKYTEALESGQVYEQTYRIIMPDGSIKWIMDRCAALERAPDGTPVSVEGYMFDVTEHKRLEAAEMSELMLDTTPLCIQLWDRNFNTIDCNEAAVKLYGFENKREYVERFTRDCSPEFQPDGQRSDEKAVMLVSRAFEGEKCVFDWMHQMPDGTPMPSEVTLVRVSYKDDYLVVGYTRDLRDILRLEAKAEKIYFDPLTGIYNRRFFDENMERSIKSLSRSGKSLSLMMVDIDRFKNYNDTYGHSEGDRCLKAVAQVLSENLPRTDDFVARYGGEEFTVVLPNTDEQGACLVAEKLLKSIRDCKIPHEKSDVEKFLTVSIGVITGNPMHTQSIEDYIKRADEMMYKSKRGGRNRYTFGDL